MEEHFRRDDISLDQQLALKQSATRLAREFEDVYGAETIERFLHTSYDQFADDGDASRNSFHCWPSGSPSSGSHALWPRSRATPTTGSRPCCSSACTTPVAPRWHSASSSTTPATGPSPGPAGPSRATRSTPQRSQAMAERGIDISAEYPKPWTDEIVRAADVVITMGCGDACPIFPGKRYEEWTLDDPAGQRRRRCSPGPRRDRAPSPRPARRAGCARDARRRAVRWRLRVSSRRRGGARGGRCRARRRRAWRCGTVPRGCGSRRSGAARSRRGSPGRRGLQRPEAAGVGLGDLTVEQGLADAATAGGLGDVDAGLTDTGVARPGSRPARSRSSRRPEAPPSSSSATHR